MGAADPAGEIGMSGVDAGVDERDVHARPLGARVSTGDAERHQIALQVIERIVVGRGRRGLSRERSEEHTSELQSLRHLVCRLLLEKKKKITPKPTNYLIVLP